MARTVKPSPGFLGTFTAATLPLASNYPEQVAFLENGNENGALGTFLYSDGEVWLTYTVVQQITAAQQLAPTAAMLAKTHVLYQLNEAPYTFYQSNGVALAALGAGGGGASAFADLTDKADVDMRAVNLPLDAAFDAVEANVAANAADIAANAADIAANTAAINLKAPKDSPVFTGTAEFQGPQRTLPDTMAALEMSVAKGMNVLGIAADSTITFSGTPTSGTWIGLDVRNTDGTGGHVLTFPAAWSPNQQANITNFFIPAAGRAILSFYYDGAAWVVLGELNAVNNFTATVAPGVNDDVTKGYGVGSLWVKVNATEGFYVCANASAGAAVWISNGTGAGGGTGDVTSIEDSTTDGQMALFSGATGKEIKKYAGNGDLLVAGGVPSTRTRRFNGTEPSFLFMPLNSNTNNHKIGIDLSNLDGSTNTSRGISTTSSFTSRQRFGLTSALAAVDRMAGQIVANTGVSPLVAPSATVGGFKVRITGGIEDAVAAGQFGIGIAQGTPAWTGASQPSAMTNCIMLAGDSGDAQLSLMHNDGAGACTKVVINGGAGFPNNTSQNDFYLLELRFYNDGVNRKVDYYAENLSTGATASGTITTDLPASGVTQRPFVARGSAANASTVIVSAGQWAAGAFL